MDIAQVSTQFFSAAIPAVSVAAGIVGSLLVISGCVLRWRNIRGFVKRYVFREPQYDYRHIFTDHLYRLGTISDRRELYPAILSAARKIVGAQGASLIVRDVAGLFQIKATCGLKPFSFETDEIMPFLNWLEERHEIVTRKDLVSSKDCREIKGEGLSYFVQFDAEASLPLFVNDKLYGVINLSERDDGNYDGGTRDILKLLSVQFATIIHNANLYQALIRQNQNLQEASRFKTQLLANLSHELRTPLSSIIGLSELMAEGGDGPLNDEQVSHLSLIRQSGMRLLDTVTAMLDLSKLEVNRLDLNVQKINLYRAVTRAAQGLKLNDQTSLEVGIKGDTPGVYGDEERITQVLKHLLHNAAKFTHQGKIFVEAEKSGEMLKIKVRDTGIGIARENQTAIFEGFRQVDGSTTRAHEGLGLGLAISKKLVELHGGRFGLVSKIGKGSEFYFTLPLKPIGVYGQQAA